MSDEREKLLNVMNNLESDYRSGKISAEKYSYFRSKYEDKLNSIDAKAATRRIRSMQGKPSNDTRKTRLHKKPTKNKKKEEQDLVQKYIINPKKDDSKYTKKKNSGMDSGTFKLVLVLILVVAFTAGIAYGIFNLDIGTVSDSGTVAIVSDTAFPEVKEVAKVNKTAKNYDNSTYSSNDKSNKIETTTDTSTSSQSDSSSSSSQQDSGSQSSKSSSQGGSKSSSGGSSSGSRTRGGST